MHSLMDDCISKGPLDARTTTAFPRANSARNAPGGRDWFNAATPVNTRHHQQRLLAVQPCSSRAVAYQYAKYGLITNGPLQGTAFDAAGNPQHLFEYGSNGTPAKNAAGTVNGCAVGFCVGGDNSAAVGIGASL